MRYEPIDYRLDLIKYPVGISIDQGRCPTDFASQKEVAVATYEVWSAEGGPTGRTLILNDFELHGTTLKSVGLDSSREKSPRTAQFIPEPRNEE
jgi:hypothetical protein